MASPNISFDQIPASIRKPGVYAEWNAKMAMNNLPTNPQRVVLIGQRLDGSNDDGQLMNVFSEADVAEACGSGSLAHLMTMAAIKAYPYATLSLIAVADHAAAVAAKATVTITGTARAQGNIGVLLGNNAQILVPVSANDAAAAIATALVASINDQVKLPVTASAEAGVITLVAKNKGAELNGYLINIAGKALGVTAVYTDFAGGTTNPDIEPALTSIAAEGHDFIALCVSDAENAKTLRSHTEAVSDPREKRWAVGVIGAKGSLAESTTLAGGLNSQFISIPWYRGTPSLACELAAAYAVVVASEEDPARPLNTLRLEGIGVCPVADKTLRTEQENALYNGITPIETSADGSRVQIVRAITTYTKSATGTSDPAYLDLTTVRTLIYMSKAFIQRIELRFPRSKLSARTPALVRSELLDVLYKAEELEFVENVDAHKAMLIVEKDSQDVNRLNTKIPTDVVNGLHVVGQRIDLIL